MCAVCISTGGQGFALACIPQVSTFGHEEHNRQLFQRKTGFISGVIIKSGGKVPSPQPASADNSHRLLEIAIPPISPGVKMLHKAQ